MNAETLHAIAIALKDELEATQVRQVVSQLLSALSNQVNQPAESSYQQEVGNALAALRAALPNAASNEFSPAWRQALDQLGVGPLLGSTLMERVDEIFARNQITTSVARDEIEAISKDLDALDQNLDQLVAALEHFDIGAEQLAPGEAEIGFTIPRGHVRNELGELGEEFEKLRRVLAPFLELATGSRPDVTVRTISSSDFGVLLDAGPKVAGILAVAVAWIITQYKQLLEIRKIQGDLKRLGGPDDAVDSIEAFATSKMTQSISELADKLIADYGELLPDDGRRHELRMELNQSLQGLAHRIDVGFHVEVRAEPPAVEPADAEDEAATQAPAPHEDQRFFDLIAGTTREREFLHLDGPPILSLPEPEAGPPSRDDQD